MRSFLCEGTGSNAGTIIIYVVLILVLVAMLIMPYFTQKKKNQEFAKMLDSIRVGDLVKTAGGIIGKVTKITDKGEIKTVILETGSKSEKSYMEFDMSMIYCVLKSTKPVETEDESDKNTSTETKVIETAKVEENVANDNVEKKAEENVEEPKAEEKAVAKKKVAKKSSTKTTAKKTTKTK